MPLVEQELLILLQYLSSPPVFSGICVIRSLVLCVCFVGRCLSFCTFSFDHCAVCSSSIYGNWLPIQYLQTLLRYVPKVDINIYCRWFVLREWIHHSNTASKTKHLFLIFDVHLYCTLVSVHPIITSLASRYFRKRHRCVSLEVFVINLDKVYPSRLIQTRNYLNCLSYFIYS
jgi:hypothetical protein